MAALSGEINDKDLSQKLKWMMLFRLLAALLLLGGTIVFSANENLPFFAQPFTHLYWLSGWIILLSLCYTLIYPLFKNEVFFAYLQIGIDTLVVTAIIFLTGSFSSIFTFLYLIVIICASMFFSRKGAFIIAGLCCLEYGIMVDLEYYQVIRPVFTQKGYLYSNFEWNQVIYKMCTVMLACFVTTVLSGYLAEKERRTKSELLALEDHVKRVERLAIVGEMAAGLAHEIKNPLASLSGSIQMMTEPDFNESDNDQSRKKLMNIAIREADRLNRLVGDFLLFARPVKIEAGPVDISRVVDHTVSLFQHYEKYKDRISLIRREDKELMVNIDSGHLKQVVLNMLLNAAEAMNDDEGKITISSFRDREGHVRIEIADDGEGIDESLIKNIFDPFFTTKNRGTGLGLSIVLRIVEAYGGRILVNSSKNTGTTFTLVF